MHRPFKPLPGIAGGAHHFVVCVCVCGGGESQTYNIIPHKYLVEPTGRVGRDNFYGWNREEREDFDRLMIAFEHKAGEYEQLRKIQKEGREGVMYPPKESLYLLVLALPFPPSKECAAIDFLDGWPRALARYSLANSPYTASWDFGNASWLQRRQLLSDCHVLGPLDLFPRRGHYALNRTDVLAGHLGVSYSNRGNAPR